MLYSNSNNLFRKYVIIPYYTLKLQLQYTRTLMQVYYFNIAIQQLLGGNLMIEK